MQINYSKTKFWTLLFCLFLFVSFNSCKKDCNCDGNENGVTANLNETTWESGDFESTILLPGYHTENYELEMYCKKITISFKEITDGDNKIYMADINIEKLKLYDPVLVNWIETPHFFIDPLSNFSATYNYALGNLEIKVDVSSGLPPKQTWAGKIEGNKMTLNNVFGKTVEFRKK